MEDYKLPDLPEWTKMDNLGGLVPSEIRQAMTEYAKQAIKQYLEAYVEQGKQNS